MDPLWLALLAIVFVIASVLVLRLHPFLALIFGALLVAIMTPPEQLADFSLRQQGCVVQSVENDQIAVESGTPATGSNVVFRQQPGSATLSEVGEVLLARVDDGGIDLRDASSDVQPGDRLVHRSLVNAAKKASQDSAGKRLSVGFGETCRKIGILIAMASVIGICLLESGAAQRIVQSTRKLVGDDRTPLAFAASGFVVGIPVFFDTVFYLLMPLARAMRLKTGKNYLLYVMSIVVGATMAHSLVPPTPGPLFVAAEMGVSIGMMMMGGIVVGFIAVTAGFMYVKLANHIWEIPLREPATTTGDDSPRPERDPNLLPPLGVSLLPILLPVILLTFSAYFDARMQAFSTAEQVVPAWMTTIQPYVDFVGDKNIALIMAAVIALMLLFHSQKSAGISAAVGYIQHALSSGGLIILITAAGGAFGHVLRESGVAGAIQHRFPTAENSFTLLFLAFFVTAIVRFAQGSATVAMITSVSIVAPLAAEISLSYHPLYLALAIGCGSKPLAWMNDSGFWVVGRMSGMTEGETLKIHSVTLTIMGIVGFLVTLAGARWLPLT